jgi:hypothetical protein
MILWVLVVIIILVFMLVFLLLYLSSVVPDDILPDNFNGQLTNDETFAPIMHARCKNTPCGGDLICDDVCYRCKQKVGGKCATNIDCQSSLLCHNWICTDPTNIMEPIDDTQNDITINHSDKHVHWEDVYNTI